MCRNFTQRAFPLFEGYSLRIHSQVWECWVKGKEYLCGSSKTVESRSCLDLADGWYLGAARAGVRESPCPLQPHICRGRSLQGKAWEEGQQPGAAWRNPLLPTPPLCLTHLHHGQHPRPWPLCCQARGLVAGEAQGRVSHVRWVAQNSGRKCDCRCCWGRPTT